jgi:hypothetical protein
VAALVAVLIVATAAVIQFKFPFAFGNEGANHATTPSTDQAQPEPPGAPQECDYHNPPVALIYTNGPPNGQKWGRVYKTTAVIYRENGTSRVAVAQSVDENQTNSCDT